MQAMTRYAEKSFSLSLSIMLIKLLNLNYIIEMSTPYSRNFSGAGGIYVNDLPGVATRQCGGRESNPPSVDHESSARTTTLPTEIYGVKLVR